MGFKNFRADISAAAQLATAGAVPGVQSVKKGDADGEVTIEYHHDSFPKPVRIQALAQNVSEYPDDNTFLLWTDDPEPPQPVVAAIASAQDYLSGLSISSMVTLLAAHLNKAIAGVHGDSVSLSQVDDEDGDDFGAAFDDEYPSDDDEFGLGPSESTPSGPSSVVTGSKELALRRIRRDLRHVRKAGFRVGLLDGFGKTSTSGIVSISVRINKLGLSEQAMEAWNIKPTDYVVLLLRFIGTTYRSLERVLELTAAENDIKFRFGKCNRYKPTISQAASAFVDRSHFSDDDSKPPSPTDGDVVFEKLFISNSMDSFMCQSFISLLKIREEHGLDWEQANEYLLRAAGLFDPSDKLPPKPEKDTAQTSQDGAVAPEAQQVLDPDHLLENGRSQERSFPFIAMQFAMRYFVKCTEYCLKCHRRLDKGFEALRPYVCSDPLCLFQYMAMGLGPSVEHEILTEPYVVDLLVSLCYAATQENPRQQPQHTSTKKTSLPIRTLPVGLRFKVPDMLGGTKTARARLADDCTRLVFDDTGVWDSVNGRLAPAQWIALRKLTGNLSIMQHARILKVDEISKAVTIQMMSTSALPQGPADPVGYIMPPAFARSSGPAVASLLHWFDGEVVDVCPYDTDFDDLDDTRKGVAMRMVLDTLPPILQLEEWLIGHPSRSLRSMERVSPAAMSLLTWIVGSNRSCILQIERSRNIARENLPLTLQGVEKRPDGSVLELARRGRNREHERILGMEGWVQFRFAQGAPDKELRFNRALREVMQRKGTQEHPTFFAWHGSYLGNWHSIIRTGLDFTEIACGRAYGHGVYFSSAYNTSAGYAMHGHPWPNSDLKIDSCMSLVEIINAPDEFVSRNPHFVVAQQDWHQCRYLFARKSQAYGTQATLTTPSIQSSGGPFVKQPPELQVYGVDNRPLHIPVWAMPRRTVASLGASPLRSKRKNPETGSDDDDTDDGLLFLSGDESETDAEVLPTKMPALRASGPQVKQVKTESTDPSPAAAPAPVPLNVTAFQPDAVDLSSIPRLQPPSFATPSATRSLSVEVKKLQEIQSRTPCHELGWHIDFDNLANLYQWIVQLHSFDLSLPLAQDMQAAEMASIVLELRFGPDFPFSPPFVRVIRPRFLPFLEGGGGHVTAGGAMCMELLTASGWSPATSIESLLLQVRLALCSTEPRPARRHPGMKAQATGWKTSSWGRGDYGLGEAMEAYARAVATHGWVMPEKWRVTATGV
ncbi:hypothetical protein VTJ49DRAFT_1323 [Mycothermus thermophilus]|uniref:UBC core domain-containing protein n=1 Tax=Humicola insolens TaxID=85995 RepID=A0ABR3VDB3_HUMIN